MLFSGIEKLEMKNWRPIQAIQAKVIGICVNENRLLAMEVYDDSGKVKGVRPLGGLIEFGETREVALAREFREELNTEIELSGKWRIFENLYMHEGSRGHELMFAIGIRLKDKNIYNQDVIAFSEDSGQAVTARWYPIEELKALTVELYPEGLLAAM